MIVITAAALGNTETRIDYNILRVGLPLTSDFPIFAVVGTVDSEVHVVEFISQDSTDHTIMAIFNAPGGDLAQSVLHSETDGGSGVSSEIQVNSTSIILGDVDSQGILDTISQVLDDGVSTYLNGLNNLLLLSNSDGLRLDYLDRTGFRDGNTGYSFSNGDSNTSTSAVDNDLISLPSTRPTDVYIVVNHGNSSRDVTVSMQYIFPGIITVASDRALGIGSPRNLTDVSAFGRRIILTTDNFNASYAIDEAAFGGPFVNTEYYKLSDGRDLNTEEQDIIDSINRVNEPLTAGMDTLTIVGDGGNMPIVSVYNGRQGELAEPTVIVTEAGSSGLSFSDIVVHTVDTGNPATRTSSNLTTEYSTSGVITNATGWNFRQSIGGARETLTTWPTTGDIIVLIGLNDFAFNELSTTLGLDDIDMTARNPTFSTMTFHYRFLGLVDATTTYDVSEIRTFGVQTGVGLFVTLDATTAVQSMANTDPAFADGNTVGLSFTRTPVGDINTDIPDHPGAGNPLPPISFNNFYNANDGSNN